MRKKITDVERVRGHHPMTILVKGEGREEREQGTNGGGRRKGKGGRERGRQKIGE